MAARNTGNPPVTELAGMCPCGCGPLADLHERGFQVASLPDEERLAGLDELDRLLTLARHDAQLLDGRDFDPTKWDEGHRLIGLLKERAS